MFQHCANFTASFSTNEIQMTELTTENSVYLIFRVFSMTSDAVGARIYADPDRMRREGQLKFTANRWAVAPTARLGGL